MKEFYYALCLMALLSMSLPLQAQNACLTHEQAQDIRFTWSDDNRVTHTSTLAETAKEPQHIIALLKEVYTNPDVPGPYYNGYKADGTTRENPVYYGPIYGGTKYENKATGWGITQCTRPYSEGYTVVLVAVKNQFTDEPLTNAAKNYAQLVSFIRERVDSVYVITDGLRMSGGTIPGTMFTIRGKLNRFFYLSKGKSRVNVINNGSAINGVAPFYRMFEEFSPYNEGDTYNDVTDFYNLMIRGESMPIEHDCTSVFGLRHYFSMSGRDGQTAYDMTGLNLFIPDHRMQYWTKPLANYFFYGPSSSSPTKHYVTVDGLDRRCTYTAYVGNHSSQSDAIAAAKRTSPNSTFTNYNEDYPVKTFMYAIKLTATRSAQPTEVDGKHMFTVTLNWNSTFSEATGSDMSQVYYLYRVVNGKREAEPIAQFTDELTWSEQVEQRSQGYMVSYVVLGKPEAATYDPIPSNIASVAIPGDDPEERLALDISGKHESEYVPADEINKYANYVVLNNGVGNTITKAMLTDATTLTLHRIEENAAHQHADATVATIAITAVGDNSCSYTLTYDHQDHADEAKYGQNYQSGTFSFASNGDVLFNNLTLCDQFSASTLLNDHQSDYKYQMNIEGMNFGHFTDKNGDPCNHAHSNEADVFVYKTEHTVGTANFTKAQVDADTVSNSLVAVVGGATMVFSTSNDRNVLNYRLLRDDTETGVIAQRQNDGTVMSHNSDGTTAVWAAGADAQLTDASMQAGTYWYVPVIEAYRDDASGALNTYGADKQKVAVGTVNVEEHELSMSGDTFTDGDKVCRYYATGLRITPNVPSGLTPQFVRAWHELPEGYAHETTYNDGHGYTYRLDQTKRCYLYATQSTNDAGAPTVVGSTPGQDYAVHGNSPFIVWDHFGALDIAEGANEPFDVQYVVRFYCTKDNVAAPQGGPRRAGEQEAWTIVEKRYTAAFNPYEVVTSVHGVGVAPEVTSVRYVNLAGQTSDRPFSGINLVVKTLANGTTVTSKVVF